MSTRDGMTQDVLVLNADEVAELLPMDECIGVMEGALRSLARGDAFLPLRSLVRPDREAPGFLGLMPAALFDGHRAIYGVKEVAVFPRNPSRGLDSHLGAVLLHDGETGALRTILNASAVTAIRTAAVSGLATRLLARGDARVAAIVGTGVQARSHVDAMLAARPLSEIRVAGRDRDSAARFCAELEPKLQVRLTPCSSVEEAVRGSDIVVTTTSSSEPVILREWIADGSHINAVGASVRSAREIDGATVAASRLFVDRRESTLNESGDYGFAVEEGAITGPEHIVGEIGELLEGRIPGRRDAAEITLFKSLGIAIEDLAVAIHLDRKGREIGRGTRIPV